MDKDVRALQNTSHDQTPPDPTAEAWIRGHTFILRLSAKNNYYYILTIITMITTLL